MKLLFVVNPIAGNGAPLEAIPLIEQYCTEHNIHYEIRKTEYKGHGTILARNSIPLAYQGIVAVGGDGTILEVANGLIGSPVPLGILPMGTGNDLSRALNIPSDINSALSIITSNHPVSIDAIAYENGYFFNVASIGFDAEIIRDITKVQRWVPGKAAYYISVFLKFISYKCKKVSLKIDDISFKSKIFLIAIANGTHYGGGMNVNPTGSLCDGYIDVILIRPVPRFKIPFLLWKFVAGKHMDLPYVSAYKCKNIQIQSDRKLIINGDGDIIASTPVNFSVHKQSIFVFCGFGHAKEVLL
jgi:diacylglycerol kinase (ATP)